MSIGECDLDFVNILFAAHDPECHAVAGQLGLGEVDEPMVASIFKHDVRRQEAIACADRSFDDAQVTLRRGTFDGMFGMQWCQIGLCVFCGCGGSAGLGQNRRCGQHQDGKFAESRRVWIGHVDDSLQGSVILEDYRLQQRPERNSQAALC